MCTGSGTESWAGKESNIKYQISNFKGTSGGNGKGRIGRGGGKSERVGQKTLEGPAFVVGKDGLDGKEERELGELTVLAAVRPCGFQAEGVAGLEPVGDLFDGSLFEVGG